MITILKEWNPWWENKSFIVELAGKERLEYKEIVKSINLKEITIITGIRRSGKSTLMYQMVAHLLNRGLNPAHILFVNFEDIKLKKISLDQIYAFYREEINPSGKAYVFFDEIHKAKDWESWLRKQYDTHSQNKFTISGSSSHLLKKEYSTLLTGRNMSFEIFPLGFREFLLFKGVKLTGKVIIERTQHKINNLFKRYLSDGGFPQVILTSKEFKFKLLKQYFDDILYKDIIDRYNIKSQKVEELALFLISNFTNKISLRNLRESLGLSYDLIKEYLYYYKESFLLFEINHFSYSIKEQKTKPSKIYCVDNGLRNAVSFKFSPDEGRFAENLVCIELKRRGYSPFYWDNKGEVDFVIKHINQSITAINVSFTNELHERESIGLKEFAEQNKKVKEMILITKNIEKTQDGIKFIPLWKWLLDEHQKDR